MSNTDPNHPVAVAERKSRATYPAFWKAYDKSTGGERWTLSGTPVGVRALAIVDDVRKAQGVEIEKSASPARFDAELAKFAKSKGITPARAFDAFLNGPGADLYIGSRDPGPTTEVTKAAAESFQEISEQIETLAAEFATREKAFGNQPSKDEAIAYVMTTPRGKALAEKQKAAYSPGKAAASMKSPIVVALEDELEDDAKKHAGGWSGYLESPRGRSLYKMLEQERTFDSIEKRSGAAEAVRVRRASTAPPPVVEKRKPNAAERLAELAVMHAHSQGITPEKAMTEVCATPEGIELYRQIGASS